MEKRTFLGLKEFRERMGWLQNRLAEKLGVSGAAYSNWETGKNDASFQVYKTLFELGATVEELFGIDYIEKQNMQAIQSLPKNELEKINTELERQKLIKAHKGKIANDYFNDARKYIEREDLDEGDIAEHFEALSSHYSTLVDSGKNLDSTDIERLNVLNGFIEKYYKKEYSREEVEEVGARMEDFRNSFELFVNYCYEKEMLRNHKKIYFEKAIEVMNNLDNKIHGEKVDLSVYKSRFIEGLRRYGYFAGFVETLYKHPGFDRTIIENNNEEAEDA